MTKDPGSRSGKWATMTVRDTGLGTFLVRWERIGGIAMAMLCFLGMWALYIWLARTCLRKSVATARATDRTSMDAPGSPLRGGVPDTVPVEWIEAYRAENGA